MKLNTNVYNMSGHFWEDFQEHRSKVEVIARPNALCSRGVHFNSLNVTEGSLVACIVWCVKCNGVCGEL